MSRQQEIFNYYCLDRLKPITEDLTITYRGDTYIKRMEYKIGLRAKIKRVDSFILYTMSDDDLDNFLFISTSDFFNNQELFFTSIISQEEYESYIHKLPSINIFEFASLLDFNFIYEEFKSFIETNWKVLQMDNLLADMI